MKRNRITGKSNPSGRDAGGFIALPWSVLDSEAYLKISPYAKALLLDIARQYVRDNNGRLLVSMSYMRIRGWKSNAMLTKAKRELLDGGFIYECVKGHRPNKASWYALTWQTLDNLNGYDYGAKEGFIRSAYKKNHLITSQKIEVLKPLDGLDRCLIGPAKGIEPSGYAPLRGTMLGQTTVSSTPSSGDHLEMPSIQ